MSKEMVVYNGRVVPVRGFRTYVYGFDGQKKIVPSWAEYQEAIASGLWFSLPDNVPAKEVKAKKGRD